MSIRTRLLKALYEEIHGPMDGINEVIKDPNFQYLTGVLAPKDLILDPVEEPVDLDENKKDFTPDIKRVFSLNPQNTDDIEENNPFDLEQTGLDSTLDPKS